MAGIRLHPRTRTVQRAATKLHDCLGQIIDEHGLTWTEAAVIVSDLEGIALRHVLRAERHPDDPDRKADEA